jgi:hypothetical protein
MGGTNPLTGVGFDSYGDWYRRSRPPVALVDLPGVHVVSNVAHNVILDFFASGGWPLLVTYLLLVGIGLITIVKFTLSKKKYDGIFVSLAVIWICYQIQSIVSINQIGLMVWGWALLGLLVSYVRKYSLTQTLESKNVVASSVAKKSVTNNRQIVTPQLIAGISFLAGTLIAFPPLNSDMKWKHAIESKSVIEVENALAPNYLNHPSSQKYAEGVNLLARSGFNDLAQKYALIATNFNKDSFDAWKQLYFLPNSTDVLRKRSLSNMKRLDPLNENVTSQK